LERLFAHEHIEPSKLSQIQRIILIADGTLTKILEAFLFEKINLVKISEELIKSNFDIAPLAVKANEEIIIRKILLQGKDSKTNWIYAKSIIAIGRLSEEHRNKLINSMQTIGKLFLENRTETFKEIIDIQKEPARNMSNYFNITSSDNMLSRTYRVFSHGKPIMIITEKFPENYFQ
jgi:chorismate-pyruvate lyase